MSRLERDYFESLYAASQDPWGFATSGYEREKYERTLAALGGRRFGRALEAGCSIGVFTSMLAPYCDELLAIDASQKAITLARERLSGMPGVRIERRTLPEETPEGSFDLVVASEILYYFDRATMLAALRKLEGALAPGGSLLAVHWRRETRTYPLQGDEAHELLFSNTRLTRTRDEATPDYRLELYEDTEYGGSK
ncbi:MAG: nodulation S family protein [Rubrobacter sp.]|nr:nodulation S family protein [Rubrobacter sp.]